MRQGHRIHRSRSSGHHHTGAAIAPRPARLRLHRLLVWLEPALIGRGAAGDRVTLGDVLLAGNGGDLKSTDGLTVAAEIVAQAKGEKVTVFKKRRRHNYRRKKGHRQQHTILKIVAIGDHKEQKKVNSEDGCRAQDRCLRLRRRARAKPASAPAEVDRVPTEPSGAE